MSDTPFTLQSLDLIRELASAGRNINAIRSSLHKQDGVWFRDIDIIEAGKQFRLTIAPISIAEPVREYVAPPRQSKCMPDKVRLVPAGTHKVPDGGFRIGRKRCVSCSTNWADQPSKFCPGCEAYQVHQHG